MFNHEKGKRIPSHSLAYKISLLKGGDCKFLGEVHIPHTYLKKRGMFEVLTDGKATTSELEHLHKVNRKRKSNETCLIQ